jgi:hypothetical protein
MDTWLEVWPQIQVMLTLLASWPTVVFVLGIYFLRRYRDDFGKFLRERSWKLKGPGGFEFTAGPPPQLPEQADPEKIEAKALEQAETAAMAKGVEGISLKYSRLTPRPATQVITGAGGIDSSAVGKPTASEDELTKFKTAFFTTAQWLAHERTYSVMFGTQYQFLAQLSTQGFMTDGAAMLYYQRHAALMTPARTEYATWFNYFHTTKLVEATTFNDQNGWQLSQNGRDFLAYMVLQYAALPLRAY